MKEGIIAEITKENSTIRVVFATTALGMGVNGPVQIWNPFARNKTSWPLWTASCGNTIL